jgi:hypothetical protein
MHFFLSILFKYFMTRLPIKQYGCRQCDQNIKKEIPDVLPKVAKSCQMLPNVAKRCHKLPKVAKCNQMLPKVAKCCQKLQKAAKISISKLNL